VHCLDCVAAREPTARPLNRSEARVLKPGVPATTTTPPHLEETNVSTISRDEIYHRLEWYLKASHDPNGTHVIPPAAPIGPFLQSLTLADLFVNINKASSVYVPAWKSPLFNGVQFPWDSLAGVVTGIKDVQTFGDLLDCAAASYGHAGWQVT
jgi:hypothetical protein